MQTLKGYCSRLTLLGYCSRPTLLNQPPLSELGTFAGKMEDEVQSPPCFYVGDGVDFWDPVMSEGVGMPRG